MLEHSYLPMLPKPITIVHFEQVGNGNNISVGISILLFAIGTTTRGWKASLTIYRTSSSWLMFLL